MLFLRPPQRSPPGISPDTAAYQTTELTDPEIEPAMMYQAGDLGLLVDFGRHKPGAVLQRKIKGEWQDYQVEGKPIRFPYDVDQLPPGEYRFKQKRAARVTGR